ncbi:MAG: hypothetical protein KKB23_00720, partial [Proteobacteria bacterium]|nr:hypothetical protein [Pseudomonadota bacterium]
PFAQFRRQTQILSLEILNVFLHLKFSPSLNLNKIEHFSKVSFIVLPFVIIVLSYSVNAWSQVSAPEVQAVTAWGESAVTNNPALDKQLAITHARRTALEQVVGSYVTSSTLVRNFQVVEDRIYSKATGFINSYKILQENRGETQRTQIEALVSLAPVAEILRASGLLRKWRVGILMAPEQLDSTLRFYSKSRIIEIAGGIESEIGKKMIEAGFKTVDPRHLEKLRKEFNTVPSTSFKGIDLLITGTISLDARSSAGPMRQATCQIHCKALRVDTGEIVYQDIVGNTFDGVNLLVSRDIAFKYAGTLGNGMLSDGTPDLRAFGISDSAALQKAIHLSSAMASDIMVSQITRIPAAVSSRIALEIHGLEFSQLMELEDYLKTVEGVANVSIEEFADGIQNMEIEYDGDAIILARSLSQSDACKNMGLKVKNITKNKIILKSN